MKLYADSADMDVVSPLLMDRLIHGVTTNPTILRTQGLGAEDIVELYVRLVEAGAEEVFFQATGATREDLTRTAHLISEVGPRVVVKVPATDHGFRVAAPLARNGARVLMTAVYNLPQVAMAAAIEARYIAPYFGRMEDRGYDALRIVSDMNAIVRGTSTDLLVASVRSPQIAADLALAGISHLTAHPDVICRMLLDPASELAATDFELDAEGLGAHPGRRA